MSNGGAPTEPPSSVARLAASSVPMTAKYVIQWAGISPHCSFISSMPATVWPSSFQVT